MNTASTAQTPTPNLDLTASAGGGRTVDKEAQVGLDSDTSLDAVGTIASNAWAHPGGHGP